MKISVIICSHNPYKNHLDRTLESLRKQTTPLNEWELIVVDNLSEPPLQQRLDFGWHPFGKMVVEPALGLTNARLKGIDISSADLLLFVDDDNLLAPDYISTALTIADSYNHLGVWGAGQIEPEFEEEPPAHLRPHVIAGLSLISQPKIQWANFSHFNESLPMGAGMCVRRKVAVAWAKSSNNPIKINLGRKGQSLAACEDTDIALTACDEGLGTGVFPQLKLEHLIPRNRSKEEFLLKSAYGYSYSAVLLDSLRREPSLLKRSLFYRWLRLKVKPFLESLLLDGLPRQQILASSKGTYDALKYLESRVRPNQYRANGTST